MTDKEDQLSQEIESESPQTTCTRVLEMIYAEQDIDIIRCPTCGFPYPINEIREVKTPKIEEGEATFGFIVCKRCDKAFFRAEALTGGLGFDYPVLTSDETVVTYTYSQPIRLGPIEPIVIFGLIDPIPMVGFPVSKADFLSARDAFGAAPVNSGLYLPENFDFNDNMNDVMIRDILDEEED